MVVANVEEFGWHCTSVSAMDDADFAGFAYSVGLFHSYGQPEFITFGLEPSVAYSILSVLAKVAIAKRMYPLNEPCHDLIENHQCIFVEVPKHRFNDYVFSALWYYAGDAFPLYQIVWPDPEGRFSWHQAATDEFRKEQPVLGFNT